MTFRRRPSPGPRSRVGRRSSRDPDLPPKLAGYVTRWPTRRRSSKVAGKFDVAPFAGYHWPGVSSLGGHNYAVAKNAENKGTAADFLKFMSSPEAAKGQHAGTSNAPALSSLYTDPEIIEEVPLL